MTGSPGKGMAGCKEQKKLGVFDAQKSGQEEALKSVLIVGGEHTSSSSSSSSSSPPSSSSSSSSSFFFTAQAMLGRPLSQVQNRTTEEEEESLFKANAVN